jgi:glucan 1,3-beta-glucosidase
MVCYIPRDTITRKLTFYQEYTLAEKLGHDAALSILRKHWDTFTRFEDFNKIKQAGFNVVRIPVGYWAYDTFGSPYVTGARVYIDAAIDWARILGLKIVIDLHGKSDNHVLLSH